MRAGRWSWRFWLYKHDASLRLPYQDHLSALLHEPSFRAALGTAVWTKTRVIKELGNQAVHSHAPVRQFDALAAVRELFHFTFWLARTYARSAKPDDALAFHQELLAPATGTASAQTVAQLQGLEAQLRERDEKLSVLLADKSAVDAELARLRAEIAEAKQANAAQPDTHAYSEAETRDYFIDLLLKEAGWSLDQPRDREFRVTGMPSANGEGFVDYVLWGDDGKPLGLLEAKRTKKSAATGQQQAKLYADCLERQFGQRPVIFYSNGYEHWLWDDTTSAPREVQGFYKKTELELLIQRRTSRKRLADAEINGAIVERYYQTRAIRRIGEAFEKDRERKALVVMAAGAGKTRKVIALCDLLTRCNWAKRVLFLVRLRFREKLDHRAERADRCVVHHVARLVAPGLRGRGERLRIEIVRPHIGRELREGARPAIHPDLDAVVSPFLPADAHLVATARRGDRWRRGFLQRRSLRFRADESEILPDRFGVKRARLQVPHERKNPQQRARRDGIRRRLRESERRQGRDRAGDRPVEHRIDIRTRAFRKRAHPRVPRLEQINAGVGIRDRRRHVPEDVAAGRRVRGDFAPVVFQPRNLVAATGGEVGMCRHGGAGDAARVRGNPAAKASAPAARLRTPDRQVANTPRRGIDTARLGAPRKPC